MSRPISGKSACENLLQLTLTIPYQSESGARELGQALSTDDSQLEFEIQVHYAKVQQLTYATSIDLPRLEAAINATLGACQKAGYI